MTVHDVIALEVKRRAQLMQELGKAPVVELLGVVGVLGVGGDRIPPEAEYTLKFWLAAWRVVGQGVQRRELAVRKLVASEAIDEARKSVQPLAIVRLRARVLEENVEGKPHALLERFVDTAASDSELEQVVRELKAPVTFEDSRFGTVTLNRMFMCFWAEAKWKTKPIALMLKADDVGGARAAAAQARSLWDAEGVWDLRIGDYIVAELLALCNEWRDPDEPVIIGAEFIRRIELESIAMDAEGNFAFSFTDDDLFQGHSIEVEGTVKDGPTRAGIAG